MSRLFIMTLIISMGVCAGVGVIAVLTMGYYTWQAILLSVGIGAVIGIFVARVVQNRLRRHEIEHQRPTR